ncbi:MAG: HAD family phosphatase [Acidobacteria bacterium]|nr:MAG: HAD family phosphatase [Acidobacteriota bacterium]PYR43583.1 MAG: HAD family phosphatase [Acidobacteriota bacterium]
MSLRAIVLDFDGVIANSEPLHFQAFRDVLAEEGVTLTEGDYYARYLGFDDVAAFQAIAVACGGAWTTAHIGELAARKAARLESLECEVSILFPGAAGAVRRASAAVPIAIASGARGVEIRRVLDREGLAACFTAIVAAGDTAAGKPEPDPYLRAVTLLAPACGGHLAASECVAIEDSHWGLESARAAGLRTVAVTHTYEAAALASADLVIASLDELDLRALARLCS